MGDCMARAVVGAHSWAIATGMEKRSPVNGLLQGYRQTEHRTVPLQEPIHGRLRFTKSRTVARKSLAKACMSNMPECAQRSARRWCKLLR